MSVIRITLKNDSIMHDSSSNAMTEVALGLSMAFFALLVVALVSIGLKTEHSADETIQQSDMQLKSEELHVNKNENKSEAGDRKLFFYVKGKLYSPELEELDINRIDQFDYSVFAISNAMNVSELIKLKGEVKGLDIQFTVMNSEWNDYFLSQGLF